MLTGNSSFLTHFRGHCLKFEVPFVDFVADRRNVGCVSEASVIREVDDGAKQSVFDIMILLWRLRVQMPPGKVG